MKYGMFRSVDINPYVKRCGVCLLALSMCFLFLCPAFASIVIPAGNVDLQQTGSVCVEMKDDNQNYVRGGKLELFCVARMTEAENGVQTFTITEEFSGWQGTAEDLFSDKDTADSLAAFVKQTHPAFVASADNTDGAVTFWNLVPGAYLVLQNEPAAGYQTMLPFLAFMPLLINGKLEYNVDAVPKPIEPLPPGEVVFKAEKTVTVLSGTAPKDTLFSFVLSPESSNAPLPKNASAVYSTENGSMTVSRTGPGTINFGTLPLTMEDAGAVYVYSVHEVRGSAARYTYDESVYKITVKVSDLNGKQLSVSTEITDASGKKVDSVIFRNQYDEGDVPEIPRTGQIWWPVLLMLPVGFVLLILGFALRHKKEVEDPI